MQTGKKRTLLRAWGLLKAENAVGNNLEKQISLLRRGRDYKKIVFQLLKNANLTTSP